MGPSTEKPVANQHQPATTTKPWHVVLPDAVVQLRAVVLPRGNGQDPVDDGPAILRSSAGLNDIGDETW